MTMLRCEKEPVIPNDVG